MTLSVSYKVFMNFVCRSNVCWPKDAEHKNAAEANFVKRFGVIKLERLNTTKIIYTLV